jgi:cell division protein FtsB
MKEYQQRHTLKKLLYSRLAILVLGIICLLMLRSVMELYGKYNKVSELTAQSEKERSSLEEKLRKSEAKNDAMNTERGIEEYVRRTYPVVKEGEGVIVVYEASSSPVVPVRKDISIFERTKLFFGTLFTSAQ